MRLGKRRDTIKKRALKTQFKKANIVSTYDFQSLEFDQVNFQSKLINQWGTLLTFTLPNNKIK